MLKFKKKENAVMIELKELLRMGVEKKASDIHITVGRAPSFRINGEMAPIDAGTYTGAN